jgi:dihydroorotate dehydrogenase
MPEEQEALVSCPPQIYLLNEDEAIIHRNVSDESRGHENVIPKLRSLRHRYDYEGVFGMNLGVNRYSEFIKDSVRGVKMCSKNANYLAININPPENLQQVSFQIFY